MEEMIEAEAIYVEQLSRLVEYFGAAFESIAQDEMRGQSQQRRRTIMLLKDCLCLSR